MKIREFLIITAAFLGITIIFFYKFFLFGHIPFPGDLLVSEYKPWRTYSYLGYNPGSYPHKAQYFDTLRQLYPWRTLATDELKNNRIPLWNPYNFSGSPLLANTQSGVLYPLTLIYWAFSQPIAWAFLVLLQPLLAAIGTYLYCRSIQLKPPSAFFAGITYAYCMFMITFLEYNSINHVALWLPFLLYFLENIVRKWSTRFVILFELCATSAALAGHLQIFMYVMIFSGAYLFVRLKTTKKRWDIATTILFLLPFGLSAIQLFPTAELIGLAARAPQQYTFLIEKLLLQPYQLALFLSADLFGNPATHNYLINDAYPGNAIYIGIVPFLMALWGLKTWGTQLLVRLFGCFSLILLLFMLRSPISEIFYKIPLAFFSTASPTNAIFLLSFCLSILGAFGMENWLTRTDKTSKKILAAVLGGLFVLWLARFTSPHMISQKNLLFSTAIFGVATTIIQIGQRWEKGKKYLFLALIAITIADNWYFFQKFNSFVPRALVFPTANIFSWLSTHANNNRFWGVGNANIEANFATQYRLFTPDGYDPLYPKTYGEFLGAAKNGKLTTTFDNQTRSDAVIPSDMSGGFMNNPMRKKILDTLGIKYILDRTENASDERTFPPDTFRLAYESGGWKIFENLTSLPRARMIQNYTVVQDKATFEQKFFDPTFDIAQTILLRKEPDLTITSQESRGIATISSYMPNEVVIETSAVSNQLLILSDTYFPGWKVWIDNKQSEILVANWTLRAVAVPHGNHTVVFRYDPISFSIGTKTSMISILALVGLCVWKIKKKNL